MDHNLEKTSLTEYQVNDKLIEHKYRMQKTSIKGLFKKDSNRFENYSHEAAGLFLDYSKNLVDEYILTDLIKIAEEASLQNYIEAMFNGKKINYIENRAVMHIALRNQGGVPILVDNEDIMKPINATLKKMHEFTNRIHNEDWKGWTEKRIEHIVNIGIGGSYLGLQTVLEALKPYHKKNIQAHFISNIDPSEIATVLEKIDAEKTLFIVASKSFSTLETLENTKSARQWMLNQGMPVDDIKKHFVAISSNVEKAIEFGISEENIYPIWDWVGGRYSLWSAIGLIIPLIIGFENFNKLQQGAYNMDKHFATTPLEQNLPVLMGLLGIWYHNYLGAESYAILPYDNRLKTFVDYLQQLDMESNGKSVTIEDRNVTYNTGPIIWGNVGTNGQHAYHQLLHQGTRTVPLDFIVPLTSHYNYGDQHQWLVANAFAQSQALMQGKSKDEIKQELIKNGMDQLKAETLSSHKAIPGNRPSNTITMKKLTPENMGSLLALYEHKVFVQGIIWKINSFDQWGVELGKILSSKINIHLQEKTFAMDQDQSTQGLINKFNAINKY